MGLAAAGLVLSAIGTGAGLIGQQQNRKSIKRANKAQREKDAFQNLLSITGGGGPVAGQPISAAPAIDIGGAIGDIGSAVTGFANQQTADDAATQLRDFQERQFTESKRATSASEGFKASSLEIEKLFKEIVGQAQKTRAGKPASGLTPTFKQSFDMLQGESNQTFDLINAMRAMKGEKPFDFGTNAEIPDAFKKELFSIHPQLSKLFPDEEEDVLGLGF